VEFYFDTTLSYSKNSSSWVPWNSYEQS